MTTTLPKTDLGTGLRPQWLAEIDRQTEDWSLAQAVGATVRGVEEPAIRPLRTESKGRALSRKLLALLSWSYARHRYSSAEIRSVLGLRAASEFWPGDAPAEEDIRRFRHENRSILQRCLCAALRFQAAKKIQAGVVTRIDEAQLAREAARRLVTAIFVDDLSGAGVR